MLKDKQTQHKWDDADEADFLKALEEELVKVSDFQEKKVSSLRCLTELKHEWSLSGLSCTGRRKKAGSSSRVECAC